MSVRFVAIEGYPGYYAGSDGMIYSSMSRGPGARPFGKKRFPMKPYRAKNGGYAMFGLYRDGKRSCALRACRLICAAFHGPCPANRECSHLNGDATDDRPSNLRWETPLENMARRVEHGTTLRGERNPCAHLSNREAARVRAAYKRGVTTQAEIGARFGVSRGVVCGIVRCVTYTEAT